MAQNILQITPVVHVHDVPAAVAFFRDTLAFKVFVQDPSYAYLEREAAGIRIFHASNTPGSNLPPGTGRYLYYLDVRDVAALYQEFLPRIPGLEPPCDQHWGKRELRIFAPDGNLIVFGQEIPPTPAPDPPLF